MYKQVKHSNIDLH